MLDDRGNITAPTKDSDFIPFMRTTDILDPSRAEDPVQLSRENTRVAVGRQHYHENLKPGDFGNQMVNLDDKGRQPQPHNKVRYLGFSQTVRTFYFFFNKKNMRV